MQSSGGHAIGSDMLVIRPDIEAGPAPARYRYSKDRFRRNLLIAAGLTALVCSMVWLLLGIAGSPRMNLYTSITGLVFFAFISARTVTQYLRGEVVLAATPSGFLDIRIRPETIPWDEIKELVVRRRENEILLDVVLWPRSGSAEEAGPRHAIGLNELDAPAKRIVDAVGRYKQIRYET
ncbi:MAG: hypothetical protein H6888_14400 [Nitratireductor sp.]|nr:hypothetical protein [Nitratireductor sp.]MCC0022254.1 hypothetical protein [Nitratireductor sp.]